MGWYRNRENSWNLQKKIKDLNNINETKKIIQNEIDIMNNFKYDEDEIFLIIIFKSIDYFKVGHIHHHYFFLN